MSEEQIFLAALDLPDRSHRTAYLDQACGDNPELRRQVEALLAAHERTGPFLDQPAADQMAAGTQPPKDQTVSLSAEGADAMADNKKTNPTPSDEDADDLKFLTPSTRHDSLGRLGHYEMLQVLGRGGFGIVFRAFDDMLQRVVAVKVMAPQIATLSPARKRFVREAQSSAKVRHENVVHIYEVGEQPLPYLVMEFIPGETLQQKLDRSGPLDVAEVLRIGRQVAEGLAAAHASELIHRDIKPGNILLEGGSHKAKITDFGLARAADDASISQSGVVAGTPMFMAPEQALGHHIDQRADLFSLGSVLYQMVSGRPPFRAPSALAVLKRVAEEPPRPIPEIIPETPAWLCGIIGKLHAKNPDDRYQSAREIADVLADCEAQLKAHARVKDFSRIPRGKPQRSGRWKWVAAAVLLLPVVALAVTEFAGVTHLFRGQYAATNPIEPNPEATMEAKKPAPPEELPAVDGPPVVAFEPRTLNLLAIIDAKQDTNVFHAKTKTTAAWSLGAGALTSPVVGQGIAEFPYIPPDEYDFRIEFTCFGGPPEVNQFLARRDRSFSCILGAQSTVFGLQMIGGLNVAENTTRVDRPRMTLNERHACVVHVRNSQVSAELDGKEFVRWKTDYSDLALDHPVVIHWTTARRNRALLAVGTNGTKTIFHKAEVVEISGNGRFSRPDDPAIRSGKWKIGRAAPKELPPTYKNSIGMEFVIVPKGKAWLGGGKDKLGDQEVVIPADFYLGKYEVTQEEWQKVMGENPSHFSRTGKDMDAVKDITDAELKRFPVENVSWDDCQLFVAKLNRLEKATGWVYRLPTEAEWEYACRGGPMADKVDSAYDFYFAKPTNKLLPEQANFNTGTMENRTGLLRPQSVGSYEANRLGLFDMHGNVWEWCQDELAPDAKGVSRRVSRGGSWRSTANNCRTIFRMYTSPSLFRNELSGLRVARVPSGAASP